MAQFLEPSADTYNADGYTDQAGGSTTIYTTIDEGSGAINDADFVRSALAPTNDVYVTKLTNGEDPVSSTGHILRTRYAKDAAGGATIGLTVQLRQGYVSEVSLGTLIKERVFAAITETWTTDAYTLSGAEADAITDYTSLYVRVVANQT